MADKGVGGRLFLIDGHPSSYRNIRELRWRARHEDQSRPQEREGKIRIELRGSTVPQMRLAARLITVLSTSVLVLALSPASFGVEPPWLEIDSAHYTVITDAGEKKGREVALRFEQMRAVFANLLGRDRLHQSIPLTILALNNDKQYYQVAPLRQGQAIDVPGFFLQGEDQDFIVLNLSESEPWRAVAHDFALMLLNYNYPPTQGWFDEGLSEYFSSIRINDRQVELGADPGLSKDLAGGQRWVSLPDLFTTKPGAVGGNESAIYDAESWIVVHYLLHENKLPETGAYFGLALNQHLPVEDAIQKAYGMNSAQLEQAVKDYLHSQSAAANAGPQSATTAEGSGLATRFPVPVGADDSAIPWKPIPEPEVRSIYAGIQLRIPERREAGLKTLQDLATKPTIADQKAEAKQSKRIGEDPDQLPSNAVGNPVAHRILAWDDIEHNQFDQAFAELRDAAALNPRDMWIRYYLSVAKYRMAQAKHADMFGLANMMLDLRSVLEWYPEMANAYDLLALARNAGGGPSAALQAERAAIGLSPRDERYLYHLAEIYVASKKWDAANTLLDRLKSSNDPKIAAKANDLLSQAGTERKYGISLDAKGAAQPKYAPQKSPFDVLEEDEAKREAAENTTDTPADKRSLKYAKGRLIAIDCSKPPAAILTVNSELGLLKLHVSDYKSVALIGADDFSCEWRDRQVTVNYKPSGGTNGDLISLEVR